LGLLLYLSERFPQFRPANLDFFRIYDLPNAVYRNRGALWTVL